MSKVTQKDISALETKFAIYIGSEITAHELRRHTPPFDVDDYGFYMKRVRSEIAEAEARMDAKLKAVLDYLHATLITTAAYHTPLAHRVVGCCGAAAKEALKSEKEPGK